MTAQNLLEETIIKPFKKYFTFFMSIGGLAITIIGGIWGDTLDSLKYIPKGTGDILLKIGSAILGAGVFAAVMKSAQFTSYFQQNIRDVFYRPDKLGSLESLKEKWAGLTRFMLRDTLPNSYQNATDVIMKNYFDNELQFHFEDHNVEIEITLKDDGKTIQVRNTTRTIIILSPKHHSAKLDQTFQTAQELKLKSLIIDNKKVNIDGCIQKDKEDPKKSHFIYEAKPQPCAQDQDRKITMERIMEFDQDLTKEPYLITAFERYLKGFNLKVKAKGCNLWFMPTGSSAFKKIERLDDYLGYSRWVLADRNTLLLPGQGYILIVTVENKEGLANEKID